MLLDERTRDFIDCSKGSYMVVINTAPTDEAYYNDGVNGKVTFDRRLEKVIGFRVIDFNISNQTYDLGDTPPMLFLQSSMLGSQLGFNPYKRNVSVTPPSKTVSDSALIGVTYFPTNLGGAKSVSVGRLSPRFNFPKPTYIDSFDWTLSSPSLSLIGRGGELDPQINLIIEFFFTCQCH